MSFSDAFRSLLQDLGSNVEIIRDIGLPNETKLSSRTLKNREKHGRKREYFGFLPRSDVRVGDVLQLAAGGRDQWEVVDTEDEVAGDEVVQIKALVEKRTGATKLPKVHAVPLELGKLHSEVIRVASKYVIDGHLRPAIVDTFIALEKYVQTAAGSTLVGANLMQTVFSQAKPVIRLSPHDEEQAGFMMLFGGAMKAVRNQYAHNLVDPKSPDEALEWLAFASSLFRLVDDWKKGSG